MNRRDAIASTVDRVSRLTENNDVDASCLIAIKHELLSLAQRRELFTLDEFAPPELGAKRRSCLYRIAENSDHRLALYVNSAHPGVDTPAHNHTTWAIVVGIDGEEMNRFYRRTADGVEITHTDTVRAGNGVAMMPDDLHSIHIHGSRPVINFHMYGAGLEQLDSRQYFDSEDRQWKVFPPHDDIREAR